MRQTVRAFAVLVVYIGLSACAANQANLQTDSDIREKLSDIENKISSIESSRAAGTVTPDPAYESRIQELRERLDRVEGLAKTVAQRQEAQTSMSMQKVEFVRDDKDIDKINVKLASVEKQISNISSARRVEINSVYFPPARVLISDLSARDKAKLDENVQRIREEKPARVVITAWSDSKGTDEKKKMVSGNRALNIKNYYISKIKGLTETEFVISSKVATTPGKLWRRVDSEMVMAVEK